MVKADHAASATGEDRTDTTCTFLGQDITINRADCTGHIERSTRGQLGVLTAAKAVANTALRWVGPFLPTLERAFGVSTSTLTSVIGVAELGGLTTIATGHALDRGHRRRAFLAGLALIGISSLIALIGSIVSFAVAFTLVVIGVGNLTVAGHAWISDRVPYRGRGRALGTFETAWALSLLLGATGIAALIKAFGWRGPFVALAIITGQRSSP